MDAPNLPANADLSKLTPVLAPVEEAGELVFDLARKDGWKTSEFWLVLVVALAGVGCAAFEVYRGKLDITAAGTFLTGVVAVMHYVHQRTQLKKESAS